MGLQLHNYAFPSISVYAYGLSIPMGLPHHPPTMDILPSTCGAMALVQSQSTSFS